MFVIFRVVDKGCCCNGHRVKHHLGFKVTEHIDTLEGGLAQGAVGGYGAPLFYAAKTESVGAL